MFFAFLVGDPETAGADADTEDGEGGSFGD